MGDETCPPAILVQSTVTMTAPPMNPDGSYRCSKAAPKSGLRFYCGWDGVLPVGLERSRREMSTPVNFTAWKSIA